MRRILLVASMAILLAGCAVYGGESWVRPGSTEADFAAAAATCERTAEARFPPMTFGSAGYFRTPTEYCSPTPGGPSCVIIGAGYLPQVRSAADTNERPRENAFEGCMVAGGWQPVYAAAGEAFTRPPPTPDQAVAQALTYCRSILSANSRSPGATAKFDQCVIGRSRASSGPRPPA